MTPRARFRQIVVYACFILGLSLLQVTWPDTLTIHGVRPDLALILAAVAGYYFGPMDGALTGLLCGFMLDMQSGRILGLGMLLLMVAGLLPALLFGHMLHKSFLLAAVGTLAASLTFHAATIGLSYLFPALGDLGRNYYDFRSVLLTRILPSMLVDAVIALPIAILFHRAGPYRLKPRDPV